MANPTIKTIGIFDSGIGGLTVFKAIKQYCPLADVVYLGDTARLPYGTKSPATIARYLQQNSQFLIEKSVDAIVVACNSASTVLDQIDLPIPIHGVIVAGSQAAMTISVNKKIGIMGTKATINANSYSKTILSMDPSFTVYEQACPLLVPLVEEALIDDPVTFDLIQRYVSPLLEQQVDTIVLGCTHYPILKSAIQKVVGPTVKLVDSANCIGKIFSQYQIEGSGTHHFYLSDISDNFIKMARFILEQEDVTALHVNI